jgi:molybdenum cofactor cytidylyltransferase
MICAVVLAAGESRRMGTQKLLLDYGGKSVIRHIVDQITASIVENVYVVTGHDSDQVTKELSDSPASVVINDNYKLGMLSSLRCGISATPEKCQAVLVALGDQPAITSKLINEIVEAYRNTDKGIVVPTYQGKRGHPVIVSMKYEDHILTRYDDVGLRGLLHEHSDDVFELTVSTPDVCSDMDIPADYKRQLDLMKKKK